MVTLGSYGAGVLLSVTWKAPGPSAAVFAGLCFPYTGCSLYAVWYLSNKEKQLDGLPFK